MTTHTTAPDLKDLIRDLHDGLDPQEAKARFDVLVDGLSPEEIAALEEELIREGLPVHEIQNLCDLHVSVMRDILDQVEDVDPPPGHPIRTAVAENRIIRELANRLGELAAKWEPEGREPESLKEEMGKVLKALEGIHSHYLRKEHQLFPFLERHGITGPPKVMWGVHDEIRKKLKAAGEALANGRTSADSPSGNGTDGPTPSRLPELAAALARSVSEMVYKENKILFPLAMQTLSRDEWAQVRVGDDELGYAFAEPDADFPGPGLSLPVAGASPTGPEFRQPDSESTASGMEVRRGDAPNHAGSRTPGTLPPPPRDGLLTLGTGQLTLEQVDQIFRHLPVDLSFVDASGHVRYYSETPERIFPRSPAAIGRHVENCHPPKSVHMVREIVRAFETGERDQAEFWIQMKGRFIHIQYFAVRNPEGEFLGTLEVGQDATHIRGLEGERRLLEWS